MQMYPTYSQMNNPYVQQSNPYMDRMAFLQNYQQNLQQSGAGTQIPLPNQQMNPVGKMVDSIDVVKATDIPMDGNMYFFPKADGSEIFGKQWLQNGTTRILTFKPVLDAEPNNLPNKAEKTEIDLLQNVTEVFTQRFDKLESQINEILTKSTPKTTSKSKKESDSE